MVKMGIAVTDPDDWTAGAFIKAARNKGIQAQAVDLRQAEADICNNSAYNAGSLNLGELDVLIVRDMGIGKNDAVTFRYDMLRQLEMEGVAIVNSPAAIQDAANKYHCSYLFSRAGLPIPQTKVVQDAGTAMDTLGHFRDAVMKPVFGYKGIGISRIKDGEIVRPDGTSGGKDVEWLVRSVLEEKGIVLVQEFIENSGQDIRAFVVDGEVVGSIYREAAEGWWLNNLSQGGSPARCTLSNEQESICIRASEAIGTVFAGVDVIDGPEGPRVLEINATPSGAGIYTAWKVDVTGHIIDAVLKLL
ncbi:tetrahydromethanopterin:alpha-L-glutamate ligase [Methanolobus halotolerans]|uniref:Tetrahydromethanopterin:alpha-L-glutamate ligase n=1 Tax=Methanolobus halotolerans TaxID=2052935 RepID=A0A4E0PXH0_9EURY|nr:tetrahydromethanopterin:alpha-L-glutamate ligase [Methanolobus halotolerans]TGC10731.1 tetrahydromethanopterin:alpha-L-glutamate ligase [Methanolobus halotolerans]